MIKDRETPKNDGQKTRRNPSVFEGRQFRYGDSAPPILEMYQSASQAECWRNDMSETVERQQIISALKSAQGALNPLSGFLRAPRPKVQSHLDAVRDQIRSALDAPRRPLRPRQIGDHGSRRGSGNWRRQKKAGGGKP